MASKRIRARTGCLNCRQRHRKCDEARPTCVNCQQKGDLCQWQTSVTFRTTNVQSLNAEHPSMNRFDVSKTQSRDLEIRDMTSNILKSYQNATTSNTPGAQVQDKSTGEAPGGISSTSTPNESPRNRDSQTIGPSRSYAQHVPALDNTGLAQHVSPAAISPMSMTASAADSWSCSYSEEGYTFMDEYPGRRAKRTRTDTHHELQASAMTEMPSDPLQHDSPAIATPSSVHLRAVAADLLALRNPPISSAHAYSQSLPEVNDIGQELNDNPQLPLELAILDGTMLDPDIFRNDDGIFLPGSAYQELHNTLRNHIIYVAKSNAPSRHATPDFQVNTGTFCPDSDSLRDISSKPGAVTPYKSLEVAPQREYILLKNYIDEVAPWLDKFDNARHFEHTLPMVAKSSPQLKYSILALSCRQIERRNASQSYSESLTLYQEAIHLLLPNLQTRDTSVMASCVILCVLEMMSCNPKEWRRHLDGCASLLQSMGIDGSMGGIDQALFWCFARMDVCGGLISEEETIIPVCNWVPNTDVGADLRYFRNQMHDFDMYANYSIYLCASVLQVASVYNDKFREDSIVTSADNSADLYANRWRKLFRLLEGWHEARPEQMKPLLVIAPSHRPEESPFPTVLYGNGPAISGNQIYHTSSLIMLQIKPRQVVLGKHTRSILHHARQICAISQSNTHHGSWTNSVQPLWLAGKVMSHPTEHRAILDIYRRIEKETGWATRWRADDLEEYWGDGADYA